MAKTLVFLEHHEGAIAKGSLGVLTKAAQIGGDVAGVLVGSGVRALAESAGAHGAATVWVADDERVAPPLPQPRVDVLAKLVRDEGYDTVLFAQSVLAADVAAIEIVETGLSKMIERGGEGGLL
jgi:electron transfer flavoprotein alpha subunit